MASVQSAPLAPQPGGMSLPPGFTPQQAREAFAVSLPRPLQLNQGGAAGLPVPTCLVLRALLREPLR